MASRPPRAGRTCKFPTRWTITNPVRRKPVTAVVAFIPTLVVTNGLSQSRTPRPPGRVLVCSSFLLGAALDMERDGASIGAGRRYFTGGPRESQRRRLRPAHRRG